jgi:hypothetical protein
MKMDAYKGAQAVSAALFLVSSTALMGKEGQFSHDPKAFDAASGHVISLAMRGVGTVYLTLAEWDSLEPYLLACYASIGLVILIIASRLIYDGYRGFMRGWRS